MRDSTLVQKSEHQTPNPELRIPNSERRTANRVPMLGWLLPVDSSAGVRSVGAVKWDQFTAGTAASHRTAPAASEGKAGRERKSPFLHPYFQLFISIILTAASQILLKIGVDTQFVPPWYTVSNFFAYWIWLGILAIIGSLFCWLYALKSVPLIIAFNLAATNHMMVAVGSWLFLGEAISARRWTGIFVVALGVFFVARPAARAEEKL